MAQVRGGRGVFFLVWDGCAATHSPGASASIRCIPGETIASRESDSSSASVALPTCEIPAAVASMVCCVPRTIQPIIFSLELGAPGLTLRG